MIFNLVICSNRNRLGFKFISPNVPDGLFIQTDFKAIPIMLCSINPKTCLTLTHVFDLYPFHPIMILIAWESRTDALKTKK